MNWTELLPLGLKVLSWIIERSSLSAEAKKRFIALVEQAAQEGAVSSQLRDKFKKQMEET